MKKLMRLCSRLIADPRFTIKPEWVDKAIVEWVYNHIGDVLKENPYICNELVNIRDSSINYHILENIPITNEYEDVIKAAIRNITDISPIPSTLCHRLVAYGKADLIVEASAAILGWGSNLRPYINHMSVRALVQLLNKICWPTASWDDHDLQTVIDRLSNDQLVNAVFPPDGICKCEKPLGIINNVKYIPARSLVAMLRKLPLDAARKLADACLRHNYQNTCMKCETIFRHKIELFKHRKSCDPKNEYPSVQEIMKRRQNGTLSVERNSI